MPLTTTRPARPARRRGPLTLILLVLGVVVLAANPASAGNSRTAAKSGGVQTPAVRTPGFGVTLPGLPTDLAPLQAFTAQVGRTPTTVMWYQHWATGGTFAAGAAGAIAATGATPEVTWEPWDPAAGAEQPGYRLADIAAGIHDGYIRSWARAVASYGKPVRVRFAHEMNGSWYPWAEGVNGNAAGSYVAAWRHVHDVVAAAGAGNVVWVWSPNVSYPGSTPLAGLYPGDRYADEVALDGYNWSTLQPGTSWQSFGQVFSASLAQLAAITTRPASIGEVASTEVGGDKAAWITDMFAALATTPSLRGFTWFDFDKETDWRVDSSPAALQAFQHGLATYAG